MEPKYAVYKNRDEEVLFYTAKADDVAIIINEFGDKRVIIEVTPDCKMDIRYSYKNENAEFESVMDAIYSFSDVYYIEDNEDTMPTKRKPSKKTTNNH